VAAQRCLQRRGPRLHCPEFFRSAITSSLRLNALQLQLLLVPQPLVPWALTLPQVQVIWLPPVPIWLLTIWVLTLALKWELTPHWMPLQPTLVLNLLPPR
jgi:hypothetical protein